MKTQQRRLRLQLTLLATLAFLFLAPASAFRFTASRHHRYSNDGGREEVAERVPARRRLDEPGSSPPSCISKCGECEPCKPALVPTHPVFSMKIEYYPEEWKCKCGDEIFDP